MDGRSKWGGEPAGGDSDAGPNDWSDLRASVQRDAECGDEREHHWLGDQWEVFDGYDGGADGGPGCGVCFHGMDGWGEWGGQSIESGYRE